MQLPVVDAMLDANVVSRTYFDAMDLGPTAGSIFPDEPVMERCRSGVINQEAAELYFGGNAVGGAVIDGVVDGPRSSGSFPLRFSGLRSGGRSRRSTCRWRRIFGHA